MATTRKETIKYGIVNMRGNQVRNVGKPRQATDALTWALPAYTTDERDALTPTAGLIILNTSTNKLNFYTGTGWEAITSA